MSRFFPTLPVLMVIPAKAGIYEWYSDFFGESWSCSIAFVRRARNVVSAYSKNIDSCLRRNDQVDVWSVKTNLSHSEVGVTPQSVTATRRIFQALIKPKTQGRSFAFTQDDFVGVYGLNTAHSHGLLAATTKEKDY